MWTNDSQLYILGALLQQDNTMSTQRQKRYHLCENLPSFWEEDCTFVQNFICHRQHRVLDCPCWLIRVTITHFCNPYIHVALQRTVTKCKLTFNLLEDHQVEFVAAVTNVIIWAVQCPQTQLSHGDVDKLCVGQDYVCYTELELRFSPTVCTWCWCCQYFVNLMVMSLW